MLPPLSLFLKCYFLISKRTLFFLKILVFCNSRSNFDSILQMVLLGYKSKFFFWIFSKTLLINIIQMWYHLFYVHFILSYLWICKKNLSRFYKKIIIEYLIFYYFQYIRYDFILSSLHKSFYVFIIIHPKKNILYTFLVAKIYYIFTNSIKAKFYLI